MNRTEVLALVHVLGGRFRERGQNIYTNCPLAPWTHGRGTDRRPSMSILAKDDGQSAAKCWSCGFGGSLRSLGERLVELGGDAFKNVLELIRSCEAGHGSSGFNFLENSLRDWYDVEIRPRLDEYPDDLVMNEYEYAPYSGRVPRYALDRGLSLAACRCWELGHDPFMKRLLFPVRDWRNRLVGVSGRSYYNGCEACLAPLDKDHGVCLRCGCPVSGKYLHTKGYRRELVLYGEHKVDLDWPVGILVEGNLDAVKLWQYGYRNVVASFGSAVSDIQLRRLAYFFRKLVVVGDGDAAGRKMAESVVGALHNVVDLSLVKLPEGKDPGGLSFLEVSDYLSPHVAPIDRGLARMV